VPDAAIILNGLTTLFIKSQTETFGKQGARQDARVIALEGLFVQVRVVGAVWTKTSLTDCKHLCLVEVDEEWVVQE
jgi:hypothetical protein